MSSTSETSVNTEVHVNDQVVANVVAAFEAVHAMDPLDSGFCQHILLNVLDKPAIFSDAKFVDNLKNLPSFLRMYANSIQNRFVIPFDEETPFGKLVIQALSDRPFLLWYLDGKPRSPMF